MHDFLLENSIMYKELVQEGIGIGLQEGIGIGREQGLRQSIEAVVTVRFPDLLDLARGRVERIHDEQQLRDILLQLVIIPTEGEAHRFLTALPD